jgi:hypothetical protein
VTESFADYLNIKAQYVKSQQAREQRVNGATPDATPPTRLNLHQGADILTEDLGPRGWLLGTTFCRELLSALAAEGAAGKTALRHVQYLAVATGKPLTGEYVHCRAPVLILSFEDGLTELKRRLLAAMRHHQIWADDVRDYLFFDTPQGLKMLREGRGGARAVGELYEAIAQAVTERGIGLVAVDPFVKTHEVNENDNAAMDQLCTLLATLATDHHCAVDFIHHAGKGAALPGDANRSRGASAIVNAARLVRTITTMSAEEAKLFGVAPEDRPRFFRVDDAKINVAPTASAATWFRLVSVALGNVTPQYPRGDHVQTVERWEPPDHWRVSAVTLNAILDDIDAGPEPGRRYSAGTAAKPPLAAWGVVIRHLPNHNESQAREMISTWVKNEVLIAKDYDDPVTRKPRKGLHVNAANRPT